MLPPQAYPVKPLGQTWPRLCRVAALAAGLTLAQQSIGPGGAAAGDAAAGLKVFARCNACHMIGPGASDAVGPNLNGLIGRNAGSAPTFEYSAAMTSSGLTWTETNVRRFVTSPQNAVPGTRMAFKGLARDKDVDDLLAYLKQFDAEGNTR